MRYLLILCIIITCAGPLTAQPHARWIHFDWHSDTIFGKYYPKVAMSIPLTIEQLPYALCGQLDLGATTTLLYENSFRPFARQHPVVLQKLDTSLPPYYLNGRKCHYLKGLDVQLDKTRFPNRNIVWVPNYGDEISADSMHTSTQKLVGTIAADLFQHKILLIDFKRNQLTTVDKLPARYARANFVSAIIRKGRIKIPLQIGDSTRYVMFDTGNCLGDLLLDKATVQEFTSATETPKEFLNGSTWGQTIAYYSKTLTQPVRIGNRTLSISTAQYSDLDSDIQFNKEEHIIGLIGPLFFENQIVIIDYKNSRFGVL